MAKQRGRAVYKKIHGIEHKWCTGRIHPEGKWVPSSFFYKRTLKSGKVIHGGQCKDCHSFYSGSERMVPFTRLAFALKELQFRVGKMETRRRLDVSYNTIWSWENHRVKYMQRRTAKKLISELHKARANDEARHRKSIRYGAYLRGHPEKKPVSTRDFNGPNNLDTDYKKQQRHRNPEQARIENERAKAKRHAKRLTNTA